MKEKSFLKLYRMYAIGCGTSDCGDAVFEPLLLRGDGFKNHFSPRRSPTTTSKIIFHLVVALRRLQKSFFIPSPTCDSFKNHFSRRRSHATASKIIFHPVVALRRCNTSIFSQCLINKIFKV
jgi:hypothetical protein